VEQKIEVQTAVAEATRAACLEAMMKAYEEGGLSGLCAEGRWELAVDAVKSLNLTEALAAVRGAAQRASAGFEVG